MNRLNVYLFALYLTEQSLCQNVEDKAKSTFCRERDHPIGTEKDDIFQTVEVLSGQSVILQCHYW